MIRSLGRKRRPFWVFIGGSLLGLLAVSAVAVSGAAAVPDSVVYYQGVANAAGVHVIGGSDSFPNFATGAVDNRYPLANVTQDGSPASQAKANVADYGPLVAFVSVNQDCNSNPFPTPPAPLPPLPNPNGPSPSPNYCFKQVTNLSPYAQAQYPNPPGKPVDDNNGTTDQNGNPLGDGKAHAEASELASKANAAYTGAPVVGGPTISNSTAVTTTLLDQAGKITTVGHSHVGQATFGSGPGALVFSNVDVVTTVTSVNGVAKVDYTVTVGGAEQGGNPISLTDKGVTVTLPVTPPTPPPPAPPIPGQVNVGPGYTVQTDVVKVWTVKPTANTNGNEGDVFATGVHVAVTNPDLPAGVPGNYVEYILGESATQAFAVPNDNAGTSDIGNGVPTASDIGATINTPPNSQGYTGGNTTTIINHTRPALVRRFPGALLATLSRPPIAAMFLLWEALVLGAAASLVWARRARPLEVAP